MEKKSKGFTLIEMLVGIVIGMIVVAAASVMMVSVLKSQKDVTASARLNQELGAAMAVISNEIRRAGFRVCDNETNACPDDELLIPPYVLGDDLKIGDVNGIDPPVKGDCILYRYNADVNGDANDLEEQRGFRLFVRPKDYKIPNDVKDRGVIQMSRLAGGVKCDDPHDFNDPTNNKWENLTDPDVIDIDIITGLSFSTTGSKCRNMTLPDPNPDPAVIAQYWVVNDKTATGLACESNTTPVDFYLVTEDPSDPSETVTTPSIGLTVPFTGLTVASIPIDLENGHQVFGTRQIKITQEATLTRDTTVTKRLETSVKVANPRVHCWPDDTVTECQ